MNALALIQELSIRIYSPPLTAHRDSGLIGDTSLPLSILMLVLDFRTEVEMNGIDNFIGNSTGRYARETVEALRIIGCFQDAGTLEKILELADAAGMTHERVQADRAQLSTPTVSSWSEMHGEKWDAASAKIRELADSIPVGELDERLAPFVDQHRALFEAHLSRPR